MGALSRMAEGRGKTRKVSKGNIFNMPAYVINMKERADRWKRFVSQPVVAHMKRLKRSIAINGKKMNYKSDRRISLRTRLNIKRCYRRSHYEIATLGAVGCSLSHIDVWKKFLRSGAKLCYVIEDDAILTESALDTINKLMPSLPNKWGVWLLGSYHPNKVYQPIEKKPWNRIYGFTASHSYIITREAAKVFLKEALPIEMHIDHFMCTVSIVRDIPIIEHPDVQIEFFRQVSTPRTADSNTSQHKKKGCLTCKIPDDASQIYRGHSRRGSNGMKVGGLIKGMQSNKIRKLRSTRRKR
jgi:GR25 family glycosyltransferase involved in LPS biosynthesis